MTNNTQIILAPGVELTENGAKIPDATDFDSWREMLHGLKRVKSTYHHILGDVVRFGRNKFDERADDAIEQLEFSLSDVKTATSVSEFALPDRDGLSLETIHVLSRETEEGTPLREKWAKIAKDEKLSARELQHSIRRNEITRDAQIKQASGRGSGLATLGAVESAFAKWVARIDEDTLDDAAKDQILESLWPIVSFANDLSDSMND